MNATAWVEDFTSVDGVTRALGQHGPKLVAGVLLAAIAVQAGVLITSQPASAPLRVATGAQANVPAPVRTPALELASILNAHLFGVVASAPVATADAPQTSMPLVLAGVIAVADPQKGMAIVGPNAGSAKLISVGGNIDGGVKLHSVYRDRVLLDRGGAIEALFLPKTLSTTPAITAPLASATPPGQRLQNLSQNNTLLNGLARIQAVFAQGKLTGYRIFPSGRNSMAAFTQLGLQSGDLITAINGTALDDPNRAAEVLQTLSNAGSASVTVSRNGQPQEMNLNLETVAGAAEAAVAADAAADAANPRAPGGQFGPGNPTGSGPQAGPGGPGGPGGRTRGGNPGGRNGPRDNTGNGAGGAARRAAEQ